MADGEANAAHPIQGLMQTAMQSLQGMVDVNTVVGDAVETKDGAVIVPVSQVAFGFCAGGGEYGAPRPAGGSPALPFGGGSGAGVSVRPVAFLVVCQGTVRLLPVDQRASFERLLDLAPELLERVMGLFGNRGSSASPPSQGAVGDGVAPPAGVPAGTPA